MGDAHGDGDVVEAAEASFFGAVTGVRMPEDAFSGDPGQHEETYDLMVNGDPAVAVRAGEI